MIGSYLSIDPGAEGGAVLLDANGKVESTLRFKYSSETDIAEWLTNLKHSTKVFVEEVHSIYGDSAKSMFSFGRSYGFVLGVLTAHKLSYTFIPPKTWQKAVRFKPVKAYAERKRKLRELAQRLFPLEKIPLDMADAYLIAYASLPSTPSNWMDEI